MKHFQNLIYPLALIFLAACSGDSLDGSDDVSVDGSAEEVLTDTGEVSNLTLSIDLVSPNTSDEITAISVTTPGQLVVNVGGLSGPAIVTFSSDIGEIPIPTAITDDNGQASVDIYAGNKLGAGTVTATLKDGESIDKIIVVGATELQMGSGSPFTENAAELSLSQISAGGTSVVSVNIIDESGNPYTLPVEVNFSSNCSSQGTASLSTGVTASGGIASSTYLAKGCVGDDPITVSANAGGVNLSATATINVLPSDAGSVEFIGATPQHISLQGIGGTEVSTVIFRVLDENGNPVSNTEVEFSLNTDIGGIELDNNIATSGEGGLVQVTVNSGTVSTPVRVTATIVDSLPQISSQSSLLVISTGIPDQDSFSLSASNVNVEGLHIDGTTVDITARLADAFNNPVPDGTAVYFTAEGGSITPECTTEGGACSVQWVSQNPIPAGQELDPENNILPEILNNMGQEYGGRVTILATAIGEESFADLNGNGLFDVGAEATQFLNGQDVANHPYDIGEAYVDHNEDGIFNPQQAGGEVGGENEEFADFNTDTIYDVADLKYNGVLCSEEAQANNLCSDVKSVNVRGSLVIVASGSHAYLAVDKTIDAHDDISLNLPDDNVVNITGENTAAASVIIADIHNQPMPAGTIIEFTATAGSIVGPDTFVWPNDNHNGGRAFSVSIEGEDEPKSGSLIVEVTTPSGVKTTYSPISIVITAPVVVP
ncbi:Ig-like domain-containing protein [Thalassomonas sp. M1454]|uniref:Ig-like domain-containing protein n=1 Tax=Thalassomonas sp. M1454 TaxID=2594477 RepID=UPI00117DC83B|nr:Ig-like domain-containing protein [Thalassomonas sp. M1454]TRX56409.1 hypothetical protein FNN08_02440 [Thalassomonas sp. M1454]